MRKKSDPRTAIAKLHAAIDLLKVILEDVDALTGANKEMAKTIKARFYKDE